MLFASMGKFQQLNIKYRKKKMKKIEYKEPEMEILEIKYNGLLCISNDDGTTDPNEPTPGPF